MGKKLESTDINIMYEGSQVLNHIMSLYGSVEKYLEVNNISVTEGTLNKHLKSKRINSKRIRGILVTTLNIGWDELITPVYAQIEQYADSINRHILQYDSRKDLPTVNKLIAVCKKELEYHSKVTEDKELERDEADSHSITLEKLKVCLAKLYRAKGMIYLNCNDTSAAEELLNQAIEQLHGRTSELIAYFYTDLGVIANYLMQYDKAMNYYERVKIYLDCLKCKVDDYIVFYFHYNYATLLYNIEYYKQAERNLIECMKHTEDRVNLGEIYLKLGIIHKNLGSVENALTNYKKALELFDDTIYTAIVYNNIAILYKNIGSLDLANDYILMALELVRDISPQYEIVFSFTLYEIKILQKQKISLDLLFNKILNIENIYIYKPDLIRGIKALIMIIKKDHEKLICMRDCIYAMTKKLKPNKNNDLLLNELSRCYVTILHCLDRKGV